VSEYELSVRHDLRPLVLRTALTYLELDGLLRQGTPFYAGYRLRPLGEASLEDVIGRFDEARADFLRRLVGVGRTGRSWTTLAPDNAAAALGEERERIVAALEYLDEQRLVELQPAELRQRYTVLARPASDEEVLDRLLERFARREEGETKRIQDVLALVTHDGCQVSALVGYFGEVRTEPCGHCSHCLTGRAQQLPPSALKPPIDTLVEAEALAELRSGHPEALGAPRQQARFLAGITSPATTRARLTRDPLFGALAERRFTEILAWCYAGNSGGQTTGLSAANRA
jgi:ATP-dependent DNA helicase RecQ